MKTPSFWLLLSITALASNRYRKVLSHSIPTVYPRDECSAPVRDTCTFYLDCLEDRNYDCGASGYPLGYGQYYCEQFTAAKPQLSPAGQTWVSDTMLCLQTALVPEATGAANAVVGCSALYTLAFSTHAMC
jgi:hypothetical protein